MPAALLGGLPAEPETHRRHSSSANCDDGEGPESHTSCVKASPRTCFGV
jgi:hypothetical protein